MLKRKWFSFFGLKNFIFEICFFFYDRATRIVHVKINLYDVLFNNWFLLEPISMTFGIETGISEFESDEYKC